MEVAPAPTRVWPQKFPHRRQNRCQCHRVLQAILSFGPLLRLMARECGDELDRSLRRQSQVGQAGRAHLRGILVALRDPLRVPEVELALVVAL